MSLQLYQTATVTASRQMGRGEGKSDAARQRLLATRGEPLFLADWLSAVFLHFEVPAAELQRGIPFELDLRDGRAHVSLVAFTMNRMRPRRGGRLAAWLLRPISTNRFLNVRTYVRYRGEPGIYFIREWLDNRLSVLLGPQTFGLPYRFGKLDYHCGADIPVCRFTGHLASRNDRLFSGNQIEAGLGSHSSPVFPRATGKSPEPAGWKACPTGDDLTLSGVVRETGGGPRLAYRATLPSGAQFQCCASGSLDDFLIERYLAFTSCRERHRFFRVWHPPWRLARVAAEILDDGLVAGSWPWFARGRLVAGHFSPGVEDVWMGRPQRIVRPRPRSSPSES